MDTFILKPIFWNTNNYKGPSGVKASSGYPKDHGYGHEEWNNSDLMKFEIDGVSFRAFHTEETGKTYSNPGQSLVFMYASHSGLQVLVGIAGSASCIIKDKERRVRLYNDLGLNKFRDDAWRQSTVRNIFKHDEQKFKSDWDIDSSWIPNWICPDEMFLWFDEPIPLDATKITGKKKFVPRFSTYQSISAENALKVLEEVPSKNRNAIWQRIVANIEPEQSISVINDIEGIKDEPRISKTTREALIEARLGQGKFRTDILARWGGSCAVSGCSVNEVLRASHIKAWRHSTNAERLNPSNGLLLSATIDALFDRGLISFSNDGNMLVAERISKSDQNLLDLPRKIRNDFTHEECSFLEHHRNTYGFSKRGSGLALKI